MASRTENYPPASEIHIQRSSLDPLNKRANSVQEFPPVGVAKSIGSMISDVVSLSELQVQLFKRDTSEALQRTYIGAGIVVIGSLIILSSLPIGLMALGHLLQQTFELSLATAFFIVFVTGMVLGGLAALLGVRKLKKVGNVYQRSEEELSQNVQWLKSALKR